VQKKENALYPVGYRRLAPQFIYGNHLFTFYYLTLVEVAKQN